MNLHVRLNAKYVLSHILLAVIATLLLASPLYAQMSNPDDIARADVATGIFNKACYSYSGRKNEAISYLDLTFRRHNTESRQVFLDFAKVKKGDVWIAAFPKGVFAIVLSEDGNCHVLAQKADRDRIHHNIAGLAEDAQKNLESAVKPHENLGSATRSSGFDIVGADGKNTAVIVASTPLQQAPNKPDAVITMAISAY